MSKEELDAFVGKYDYGALGKLIIVRDGTKLIAQIPGQRALEVRPLSATELDPLALISDAQAEGLKPSNAATQREQHATE